MNKDFKLIDFQKNFGQNMLDLKWGKIIFLELELFQKKLDYQFKIMKNYGIKVFNLKNKVVIKRPFII